MDNTHESTSRNLRRFALVHKQDVEVPAEEAYRLINAVDEWPEFFPPCQSARVVESSGRQLTIEISAQVGASVRTWRSRRTLYADQHLVEFEQVDPFPPLKSMTGYWRVVPKAERLCTVELGHTFETTAELAARVEPPKTLAEAENWIRAVCDSNSHAELEALRARCEGGRSRATRSVSTAGAHHG